MKKFTVALAFICLLSQCVESVDTNQQTQKNPLLTRSVGEQISLDVAQRWIARYNSKNTRQESFSVSASNLQSLLSSVDQKLGVVLHHATDANGEHHVLVIPVKDDLQLWTNGPVLDANTDTFVEGSIGNIAAERFKELNPSKVWSHFFGIDTFDEIVSKDGLTNVDIVPAENDEGKPQLLLYVWSGRSSASGRSTSQELSVYDISAVCPPTCNELN